MGNIKVQKREMDISTNRLETYNPSTTVRDRVNEVMKDVSDMISQRNKTWRQFNDRTLRQFIDDAENRLNSHVFSKESQGKEDWQANVALPTIRDKTKRMIAGFSLSVPEMNLKVFGETYALDMNRAYVATNLIQGSYLQEENSILENFWESWQSATQGTVVKYEGYLKTRIKQKHITSYDITTGHVEFEEVEVDVDDKCISYLMPLTEFYIKNFLIHEVQDQPSVAWIRYMDYDLFKYEFGKYQNAKYVKTKGSISTADTGTDHYNTEWMDRVNGNTVVEVIKWYSRIYDSYVIIANGVLLLDSPLLWMYNGVKVYPFAKSIWEPFTNKNFFYGNAVANILAGMYDISNTAWNSTMDKGFRSLVPFLLVGRINQDAFDLEDNILTLSTKITVDDISQVKELKLDGVSQSDVAMLEIVAKGMDDASPSVSSQLSGKQASAREIVIAEEKLQELRTIHQEMLKDLWRQKYQLRLANIQMNYPVPRKIADRDPESGEVVEKEIFRTYLIDNAVLERDTGERGVLAIQFMPYEKKDRRKLADEVAVEEEVMRRQGINYKKLILPVNYLDNARTQIEVITDSLRKISMARMQATVLEKVEVLAKLFPQIFVASQEEYYREVASAYDEDPEKALAAYQQITQQMEAAQAEADPMAAMAGGGPKGAPTSAVETPQ